ncbi:MAG: hypothetical protein LQ350_002166 [Teloschistes chrysophthalmus]|nr:MAG: hypothetical protein LQ350_002166 [Niorma chrysophthalma]
MPPKQATLGKFFGGPNPKGSKTVSRQSTLAFNPPRNTFGQTKASAEIQTVSPSADGVDVPKANKSIEDVKIGIAVGSDLQPESGTIQSKSPKRRQQDLDSDESEVDEEPVQKRSKRRGPDEGKTKHCESTASSPGQTRPEVDAKVHDGKLHVSKPSTQLEAKDVPTLNGRSSVKATEKLRSTGMAQDEESSGESDADDIKEEEADSEDEEKPEVAAKARAKVQSTFKASRKDPYPDWTPGHPVPYAALCTTFSLIEMTTKRLDLLPTVLLMMNKLAADYAGVELGIGESLIMRAIGESTGRSLQIIKADQGDIGDLGLVAAKSRANQPTMFKPKALTVNGVLDGLMSIATISGDGSQGRKIAGIKKLLSAADVASAGKGSKGVDITKDKGGASETKFIIRFLEGKLRLGLAEKTVLVALAHAMVVHETAQNGKQSPSSEQLAQGEAILRTVYCELPSYEVIIPAMLEHGIFHLHEKCKLQPGVPLKPMLARPTKSITEVLDRFEGKDFTCEYKYDGERAQIHYVADDSPEQYAAATVPGVKDKKGLQAIFSRNSEDLSKKYPDILAKLNTWVKKETKSFVLDCETVAWDVVQKQLLPFQTLMTRKRKDVKADDVTIKVCVFAFDILFYNGKAVVEKSLRERRELLHNACSAVEGEFAFAQYGDTSDLDEIQILLDESVKASCEGLMVKMLDTNESGYEPSIRSRNWLKVKKDYLSGIGDSLDLVVLGAYYGKGKRTSVYGAFLLACYNASTQTYETVCNVGTGFSEAILEEYHSTLGEIAIEKPKPFYSHSSVPKDQPDVWFEPRVVWEIKAADLTLSPRYKAAAKALGDASGRGISLRFPRFLKAREDKKAEQATESRMVVDMYKKQEAVRKDKGPSVDDDFEY